MMPSSAPYQVPYQNQLQFNLGVPLTTQNLAVQFNRPSPIFVERVGGQHGIPGKVSGKAAAAQHDVTRDSAFNYSALSEDKMEMMSQLAKRDLRNRKLQMQMQGKSASSESISPASSPSRTRLQPNRACQRFSRENAAKPRRPLTAKEAGKNRTFGAVQTPPPRRPVKLGDDSMMSARDVSMNTTKDNDVYFPAKPIIPEGSPAPKDELAKLQQEIEGYLLLVEHVEQRAISERSTKFLHPPVKGKQKDGYLAAEEDLDRARIRIEQNTRSLRNIYNLRQKVKQLQRDVAHADLSKPAKKSQIISQLGIVHRGAVKAVQTFVNQLPHQDLRGGLPSHYHELALLVRQLTALSSLTKQGKTADGSTHNLLAVLDRVDSLNAKWCAELKKLDPVVEDREKKKPVVSKTWVSDTKVDKDIFVMKNKLQLNAPQGKKMTAQSLKMQQPQQRQQRGRPERRAPGKENRGAGGVTQTDRAHRNAELRAGIASLLHQTDTDSRGDQKAAHLSRAVAWEVEMGKNSRFPAQDPKKGYLLPTDLIVKREKAQRAVALSNQPGRFAESTSSSRQKMSTTRASSAPASPSRKKEVNFDLGQHSPVPWVPPGRSSRSRSLSSERRSRSRSMSPFYLRDVDHDEVRHMFPGKHSLRAKKREEEIPSYGFRSLPTERKLRSADVSNSFVDEVEHRLLQRLMGRKMEENTMSSKSKGESYANIRYEDTSIDTTGNIHSDLDDEPLDATDLEVEAGREAASLMDAPTLENVKLRLAEMQREQREIRQRWSSLKFVDTTKPRSRIFTQSDIRSDRFREPPAIEITRMSRPQKERPKGPINKEWVEEPVIFTKPQARTGVNYLHTVMPNKRDDLEPERPLTFGRPPKKLLTLKQTTVERIAAERDKFESYLRKRSHHPTGKFDPWKLVEEISDEILSECMRDVASEVETINEEIANHMYKSEFMVEKNQPDASLQREYLESPTPQPIGDGLSGDQGKVANQEPVRGSFTVGDMESQSVRGMASVGAMPTNMWGSGDRPMINEDRSLAQRSHSTPRSPAHLGSGKQSPNLSATEPLLEDVSHLLHHRADTSEEREVKGAGDAEEVAKDNNKNENYEDDYEDEDDDDDDDDEDDESDDKDEYSEEDFEDVTDEEL